MAQGKRPDGRNEVLRRVSDTQVIALVDSRRIESLRYNWKLFNTLPEWYKLYRNARENPAQFRNNVAVPFLFAMMWSDVSRKVQTSFGSWPIVEFAGYDYRDSARAKKNEILISAQMKDSDSMVKAIDFFLMADLCGTAVARYGWLNITRKNRVRIPVTVAPGVRQEQVIEYDAEHFDGPNWNPIDRLDFWQQPGRKKIEEMDWVIHRYWEDLDNLKEDARSDDPYFDPEGVKLLEQAPMPHNSYADYTTKRMVIRGYEDQAARYQERYAKPVEIWEMWGLVPEEFAPDGIRTRCIAIGNGRVVLKNREIPFWDSKKPFLSYSPMPDPYSFDAPGKVEIVAPLQRTANRIANQKLDALDLIIDPMWVASNQVNINTQSLFSRAGRVLLVDGDATDANIRPLTPDIRGFQQAYGEIAQLWEFMQLGSGINDIVMGLQPNDRETARGFLGRQENVLTRLSLEARAAEEMFIEPLANAFRKLDQQYLTLPHEIKILGSLAVINPITGLPLPQEPVTLDYDDFTPDYRARAIGATQMMGRNVRQQNYISLLQMMSANPALMQLVNWANFARQGFELFDFKNIDELLVSQVPMVNQIAQQTGQDPTAVAQTVSTPLEQLNPEILGSLMGGQNPAPLMQLVGS